MTGHKLKPTHVGGLLQASIMTMPGELVYWVIGGSLSDNGEGKLTFRVVRAVLDILDRSTSPEDVCERVTRANWLNPVLGCKIARVGRKGEIISRASFGHEAFPGLEVESVWSDHQVSRVIQTNEPRFASSDNAKLLLIPISRKGLCSGVAILVFSKSLKESPLTQHDTQVLAMISGLYLNLEAGWESSGENAGISDGGTLSNRQIVILDLMSKGLTNRAIALEMHLSESSIRHESMRIYKLLGVSSRFQAIERYEKENTGNLTSEGAQEGQQKLQNS
jgi:DNA-binding CsgD family transcriptional regulator